MKDAVAEID